MAASGLVRWGAIGLILGGVVWIVLGLSAVVSYLQAIPSREDVVLFVGVGFYIALAAVASRIVGAVVYLAGSSALEWISCPSTLGMLVGFVLYGSATLQARVMPRWYGVVLLDSMPISLPLEVYGTALFGLILVVLAYVLWLRNDTTTEQPPRVS